MKIISPHRETTDDVFLSSNLKGKDVISSKGVDAGSVKDFYTDTKILNGLVVKYKWTTYFIDAVHIHEASKDAVILTIHPYYLLIGKEVYDTEGRYLGVIKTVTRETNSNEPDTIIVKKSWWAQRKAISSDKVQEAKETVIIDNN